MTGLIKRIRYLFEDAAYASGRGLRSLARVPRRGWFALPLEARRRVAAGLGVAAAVAFLWFILLPIAPCQIPGGDRCTPPDETLEHVPADVVGYLHVNLASDTDQAERAAQLLDELPILSEQVLALVPRLPSADVDFNADIAPWSAGEAAVAALPLGKRRAESVFFFESNDNSGARDFAVTAIGGASSRYEGVEVLSGSSASAAIVDDFLVVGSQNAVERMIDFSAGDDDSLADVDQLDGLLEELTDDYLAYAYVPSTGADQMLDQAGLGFMKTLVNTTASTGAAATLEVLDDGRGVELAVTSELDPELAEGSPGFFGAFGPFEPKLAESVDEDLLAMVDIGDPAASAGALLAQAIPKSEGLVDGVRQLEKDLSREGVDLEGQILPLLSAETGFTVGVTPPPEGQDPELIDPFAQPVFSLIATDVDEDAAREGLARLQAPIARSIDPGVGQAPIFEERDVDGVSVQSLVTGAGLGLVFGVFDGRLVATTDEAGIDRAHGDIDALSDSDAFDHATDGFEDDLSVLAYIDMRDGITFLAQQGFGADPAFAVLAPDLQRLEGLGIGVVSSTDRISSRIRLVIGDEPPPPDTGDAAAPESAPPDE